MKATSRRPSLPRVPPPSDTKEVADARHAETLLKTGALQSAIFNSANFSSIATDAKGVIQIFNVGAEKMLGYTAAEVMNKITPADISDPQEVIARAKALSLELETPITPGFEALVFKASRGIEDIYELTYIRKDGSRFPAVVSVTALRDAQDSIIGYLLICTDNTARKIAEEALLKATLEAEIVLRATDLRNSEVFLRLTLDALPLEVAIVSRDGTLIAVNEAWKKFARDNNYPGAEFLRGAHYLSASDVPMSGSEDAVSAGKAIRSIIAGDLKDFCLEYQCDTSTEKRWFSMQATKFDDTVPASVVVTHREVTEMKNMQSQLRHKQKLESMGQLAGGVAHDFNNILTVIKSYGDLLLASDDIAPQHRKDIEEIGLAADRATSLTRQLLAFSRKETVRPRIINLNKQLLDVQNMLGRLIGEDVVLAMDLQPGEHLVSIDPIHLEQAVMNLAVNARDAMPQGGVLTIATHICVLETDCPDLGIDMKPGSYVMLSATDTGSGMDAETLERIFEPFFTTKSEGQGTGLGLSTVFGIVSQANAHIRVSSTPGVGTQFLIYFPLAESRAELAASVSEIHPSVNASGERILFVEDEDSLRRLGSRILEKTGFHVSVASDGGEALKICEESAVPFDLACIDVVMPGMGGGELADRLLKQNPDLKIVMMSGFNDDDLLRRGIGDSTIPFVQKPYTPTELVKKIRQTLLSKKSQLSPYLSGPSTSTLT